MIYSTTIIFIRSIIAVAVSVTSPRARDASSITTLHLVGMTTSRRSCCCNNSQHHSLHFIQQCPEFIKTQSETLLLTCAMHCCSYITLLMAHHKCTIMTEIIKYGKRIKITYDSQFHRNHHGSHAGGHSGTSAVCKSREVIDRRTRSANRCVVDTTARR